MKILRRRKQKWALLIKRSTLPVVKNKTCLWYLCGQPEKGINSPKFRNLLREKRVTEFEPMAPRVDTLRAIRRRILMQEAAGSTKSSKTKNTADISSAVFFGPSDRI